MVEDVDLSFCRQDFHHKSEFGKVEEKPDDECEDDGNVRGGVRGVRGGVRGGNHCRLKTEACRLSKKLKIASF